MATVGLDVAAGDADRQPWQSTDEEVGSERQQGRLVPFNSPPLDRMLNSTGSFRHVLAVAVKEGVQGFWHLVSGLLHHRLQQNRPISSVNWGCGPLFLPPLGRGSSRWFKNEYNRLNKSESFSSHRATCTNGGFRPLSYDASGVMGCGALMEGLKHPRCCSLFLLTSFVGYSASELSPLKEGSDWKCAVHLNNFASCMARSFGMLCP